MAESTKNLGSLENTLDQLVSEVSGLRSELADLKRSNTSVLNKHLVRKGSEREQHYIFFDKVSQQYDLNDSITWPACNGSAHPASNGVFENITNVIGHYQNVDWPFKVCDISTFAPPSTHKETNNLRAGEGGGKRVAIETHNTPRARAHTHTHARRHTQAQAHAHAHVLTIGNTTRP